MLFIWNCPVWGREHSAFPVHWSGILSLSHCGLLIVSQLLVAGLRLTFLTSTCRDFIFTLLVFGRPLGQAYAIGNPSVRL